MATDVRFLRMMLGYFASVRPGSLTFPERRSGQKRMTPRQRKNMMAGLPLDDGDASN